MKVEFADTFTKSLRKLMWQEGKIYKTYSFFRYGIAGFIRNIFYFRNEMYEFRWWDYRFNLTLFRKSIEKTAKTIKEKGIEVDESRLKKVAAMERLIHIMKTIEKDDFIELAEKELGEIKHRPFEFEDVPDKPGYSRLVDNETDEEKEHKRKVFKRSHELEEEYWDEMVKIIRGQKGLKNYDDYDGTGMRGWWD
jgi:hypothetical protein